MGELDEFQGSKALPTEEKMGGTSSSKTQFAWGLRCNQPDRGKDYTEDGTFVDRVGGKPGA